MGNSIYQAITNAMKDISPIAKAKRNAQQGFRYRGIDDVMNELSPILTNHRIFIYPEVIEKERCERQTKSGGTSIYSILTIKYHFATEDGSEICTTVIGEGMDSGDKASDKASNKAMAVAFKYACLQIFCIPTDDMPDPDNTTPPELKPISKPQNPPPPTPKAPPKGPEAEERIAIIGEMKDINRVTLIGRLTRDAELKAASSGLSVCRFSIAVNRSKKQGNDYADEANFFDVTLFGKQADSLSRYLLKGKRVCIDGELQQDRWQQDGQNRSKVGIAANSVQLLDGQEQRPAARKQAEPPEECDDYIPF